MVITLLVLEPTSQMQHRVTNSDTATSTRNPITAMTIMYVVDRPPCAKEYKGRLKLLIIRTFSLSFFQKNYYFKHKKCFNGLLQVILYLICVMVSYYIDNNDEFYKWVLMVD